MVSLGVWQNFGDARPADEIEAMLTRAFDLGITHFDLANNYGPPYGSAEVNFGRGPAPGTSRPTGTSSSSPPRPATTCGPVPMATAARGSTCWPASTASLGAWVSSTSTSSTPTASTPTPRWRRPWGPSTPRCARARPSTSASRPIRRSRPHRRPTSCAGLGTPLLIHQPPYSMFNRWIEHGLLDTFGRLGIGCIVFSPLAQGLLTNRYLDGIPKDSRASKPASLDPGFLNEQNLDRVRGAGRDGRPARTVTGPDGPGLGAARCRGSPRP